MSYPPHFNQKIKLHTSQERDHYDHLADLYSLITATECLERAYIKSTISSQEYTNMCLQLLAQFKVCTSLLGIDIDVFIKEYHINCPAAQKRLLIGVPATIEHTTSEVTSMNAKNVADTVQFFITLMDSLKLHVVAVDEIHPLLSDLFQALSKSISESTKKESISESSGKEKIKEWLIRLNKMKAEEELDQSQVRQLLFDLERYFWFISAYAEFQHSLK